MNTPKSHRMRLAGLATAAAVLAGLLVAPVSMATAAEPEIPRPDGLSELTAAASCWEIRQNTPSAPDGVYWLQTPAMTKAEQFYCDQTTDGGGWVLIGRGREGWSESITGSGTPEQVRTSIDSVAGFTPRQLPGELIDQLNNNAPISSLAEGVRLRRATNEAGTAWQNVTFKFSSPRTAWTWQFNNEQRINTYTINGVTRSGGQTTNFGADNFFNRVRTVTGSAEGWQMGWGYGSSARGSNSGTSYLWAKDSNTGSPRPFTQVFLRPRVLSSAFTAIPDAGTAAVAVAAPQASSFATTTNWGVNGLGAGPNSLEGSNEVSAFAEVGSNVYVGGNFLRVQKNASGGSQQAQSYLAAFNRDTGEFVSSFRPTFNNQIKALAALPNNRVAVGGYFTQVNGQPVAGLVVLDATTGQIDPAFTGQLLNAIGGGVAVVRTLDVEGNWLYVGGSFTHASGGSQSTQIYSRNAARFSVDNGTPDGSWNPELNGTAISVDASARGDRVYLAGFFSTSRSQPADKAVALATSNASIIPWTVQFSNRDSGRQGYQQAVLEVGDRVWLGGSEHSLFSYNRDTLAVASSNITKAGGDFQALATDGNIVYGGCHCFETNYSGVSTWSNVGTGWTSADAIYAAGGWNAANGQYVTSFNPKLNTRAGAGAWALFVDSTGQLWEGGDFTHSTRSDYTRQWSGGFVRFSQRDVSPPPPPTGLAVTSVDSVVTASWLAPANTADVSAYQVLRNNRVIATTAATSVQLPAAPSGTRYFVRAIDGAGNASASTPVAVAQVQQPDPFDANLVTAGATWSYLYDAAGPTGAWTTVNYDASSWATGAAPLGWGQANLGTTLNAGTPKPLASFYRKTVSIPDASVLESVTLTVRADDGVVVYVNGTEVGRKNVDPGAAGVGTYANAAVGAAAALATPLTVEVPGYLFHTGDNVITASTHSNYRSTPSHSFELTAVAAFGTQPAPPVDPEPPVEPEPPVDPEPPVEPEPTTVTLKAAGSDWAYSFSGTAPAAGWQNVAFDDSAWATGTAPLGWGHATLGTTLDTSLSPRPVTSYYRTEFALDTVNFTSATITTRADDGIIVYVNGTEVGRRNLDAGAVSFGTFANAVVSATNALNLPFVIEVPASAFVVGTNVISAEVHSNYRTTPSHSFELSATAQ